MLYSWYEWASLILLFATFAILLFLLWKFITQPNLQRHSGAAFEMEDHVQIPQQQPTTITHLSSTRQIGKKKAKRMEERAQRREYNEHVRQRTLLDQEQQQIQWDHDQECRQVEQFQLREEVEQLRVQKQEQIEQEQREKQKMAMKRMKITKELDKLIRESEQLNSANSIIIINKDNWKSKLKDSNEFIQLLIEFSSSISTEYHLVQLNSNEFALIPINTIDYLYGQVSSFGHVDSLVKLCSIKKDFY